MLVAVVLGFCALCAGALIAEEPPKTQVYFVTSASCPSRPRVAAQVDRLVAADGWDVLTLQYEQNREVVEFYKVKAVPSFVAINIEGDAKKTETLVAVGYSDEECRKLFAGWRVFRRRR